jgi:glycosyltransferase involved in cell wall biosynthesis
MKVLAVGSHVLEDTNRQSQVDIWRVGSPLRELAKHVDWQIDHSASLIPGMKKFAKKEEFTEEEMEKAFKRVCEYDIVYSSYHADPTGYTMLKVAKDKAGTQFVMDVDDDMFAINPDNPFWLKMDDEKVYWMQRMIADNDWVTTPSPVLADRFRQRRNQREDTTTVIPNYISDRYKEYEPKNKNIVIGYFGGSSHYADLHESKALEAIQTIMHEDKNLRFKSVGMVVDTYLPRQRIEFDAGKRGTKWTEEVFPTMNIDIALAPLLDNQFNKGKSNIKWQEATRAGAVFVGSNIGPYKKLHSEVAVLVENNQKSWQEALESVIYDIKLRKSLLKNARAELKKNWRLEDNWVQYKKLFERIVK